jgi:predicted ATP-grasp superfamily ATP-dependent carboligase
LGRKGIRVVGCEESLFAISFFSKYCRERLIYPSAKKFPKEFLRWLIRELSKRRYDMLLPMDDETVLIASKYRELICKYTRVPVPVYSTLMEARDKSQTLRIAIREGIPHPRTCFIKDINEVESAAKGMAFPLVIKPRESSGSRGISFVQKKEELLTKYLKVHTRYPFPLIQEFIPHGGETYGVFLLLNKASQPRAIFVHKRLREYPLTGGPSTLRESVRKPELVDMAVRILKSIKWRGVAMVEFKKDPRDGQCKLMEINPRFWGSLELSVLSGVNFPYLLYRMETEGDIEPVIDYKEGIRCRWLLPGDILHFISNPERFRLKPSFFDFSKKNRNDDFISMEDPGPTIGFFLIALKDIFNLDRWRHVLRK